MWNLTSKLIEYSRQVRTRWFSHIIQRTGITANQLTFASFMCGILSVVFFQYKHLFIILGIAHLVLDAFDGVVARATQPTEKGKYLDWISDQSAAVFLLLTITQMLPMSLNKITFVLYTSYTILFLLSSMQAPPMSARTALFLCSFSGLYSLGMLIALIITLYGYATAYHQTFFKPSVNAR